MQRITSDKKTNVEKRQLDDASTQQMKRESTRNERTAQNEKKATSAHKETPSMASILRAMSRK